MNYSDNYLKLSAMVYPPKLKMYRSRLMLTPEDKREVAQDTNDSALRLYEYYITKKSYRHFNPVNYESIGAEIGWSASKTEKCKTMLIKAGYLMLKRDTLKDKTKVYRILMGKELIKHYIETNELPDPAYWEGGSEPQDDIVGVYGDE